MNVPTTRTTQESMNLIAGTEGLTFQEALSAWADQVVAEKRAKVKAKAEPKAKADK